VLVQPPVTLDVGVGVLTGVPFAVVLPHQRMGVDRLLDLGDPLGPSAIGCRVADET
jgi:hypothetical protein